MSVEIIVGDARQRLAELPEGSVHCGVTSPPYYGLRSYLRDDHPDKALEIGLEQTPEEFVEQLVVVFRALRRALRDDGSLWLNIGDSYATSGGPGTQGRNGARFDRTFVAQGSSKKGVPLGLKPKDLIGIPWMLAFALRSDGWFLRQDLIWAKPNPMPESVRDRCTKAHEYLFLLTKSERYYFDADAIAEAANYPEGPGNKRAGKYGEAYNQGDEAHRTAEGLHKIGARETRNKRSVWSVASQPFKEAHFATFPPALIEPCILAGCPAGGVVVDPFAGSGTTGMVAQKLGRRAILIELNDDYQPMAERRCRNGNVGLGF